MTQTEDGRRILEAGPEDADATCAHARPRGRREDLAPVAEYLNCRTLRLRWYSPTRRSGRHDQRRHAHARLVRHRSAAGLTRAADIEFAGCTRTHRARTGPRHPAERIVVGGSQGGVIETGLSHGERLAGIIALSTYLHDAEHVAERVGLANASGSSWPTAVATHIPIHRAAASRSASTSSAIASPGRSTWAVAWTRSSAVRLACSRLLEEGQGPKTALSGRAQRYAPRGPSGSLLPPREPERRISIAPTPRYYRLL